MSRPWTSGNWIAASWDRLHRGRHLLLGVEQWLFRERSEFQEVAIARVPDFGKTLFLDAVHEIVEADEFVYHEAVALPALLHHPAPERVLIAGGGDGLVLREVLRDPRVERVVLVELDALVIEACREHLADIHCGSFDDPRAGVIVGDALAYLETPPELYDVVIMDLLDPYERFAVELFQSALPLAKAALSPGGIVATFGEVAMPHLPVRPLYQALERLFAHVAMHRETIESFAGAYGFLLASNAIDFTAAPEEPFRERAAALTGPLRSLVPEAFPSCFVLPPYISDARRAPAPPPPEALGEGFSWIEPLEP
jgi:spermidine synthase